MNAKIAERIDQEYREPPFEGLRMTSIPGLAFLRVTTPAPPKAHLNLPGLCLTVRGSKSVSLGDQTFTYGAGEALMVGLPLPVSGLVHVPSERAPYVGLLIELKPALLRQVALESGIPLTPAAGFGPALDVIRIAPAIESCIERMLDLVDAPAEAAFLWPMALRELAFRLLTGPGGAKIAWFAGLEVPGEGIAEAIAEIRERFRESIDVADLASRSHRSISSFHRHFLAVAKTTPLQYQKQLRLIEARRLLEEEPEGVAAAAFRVGYESPSQFSRDFSRYFGHAPRETVKKPLQRAVLNRAKKEYHSP
jgi:AraC-like DNA-binding protein